MSRFTSKFRQPANLALAAVLQRLAPVLSDIKVTALVGVITPPPEVRTRLHFRPLCPLCRPAHARSQVRQIGTEFVDTLEAKKKAMRAANGGRSAVADAADKAGAMAKMMGEGALAMADRLQVCLSFCCACVGEQMESARVECPGGRLWTWNHYPFTLTPQ